jgi:hypothetical protein
MCCNCVQNLHAGGGGEVSKNGASSNETLEERTAWVKKVLRQEHEHHGQVGMITHCCGA